MHDQERASAPRWLDGVTSPATLPGPHLGVLDLFSGLRGWSAPFAEHGHETFAIDIREPAGPPAHPRPPGRYPRRTVWYCRLGLDRAKPTDLWGVFPPGLELPPECHNGNPDHIAAPRGSRTGTQGGVSTEEAGRIPRELAERFRVALEQELRRPGRMARPSVTRPTSDPLGAVASMLR